MVTEIKKQQSTFSTPPSSPKAGRPTVVEQQQALWKDVASTRYETLPPWRAPWKTPLTSTVNFARMAFDPRFIRSVVDAPFHQSEDVRPAREKLFHRLGTCATCEFVPEGKHPWTGVFAQPTPAIVRLSLAIDDTMFSPGVALKMFRDGMPTANIVATHSLDAQQSRDFFAHPVSTKVEPPTSAIAKTFV